MRILVIEDDPNGAETLRRTLTSVGWVVDVSDNGDDGLAAACSEHYDALVVDIMMPGLNGYEVVRSLRAREVWTPVLMLSAKDGEFDQVDAFDFGADDYLTKPFSVAVLVARLRALVRRAAPERPVVLRTGELSLDPGGHVVRRGESDIELTPREFALLEFFMRNPGVVMSKNHILRSVWDTNYHGDENVVEVYVSYLRRRIDAPFGTASIETLRGVGYRFDPAGGGTTD